MAFNPDNLRTRSLEPKPHRNRLSRVVRESGELSFFTQRGAPHSGGRGAQDPSRTFPPQAYHSRREREYSDSPRTFSRSLRAAYPFDRQRDDHVSCSRHHFSALMRSLSAVRQRRALRRVGTTTRASLMPSDDSSSTQPSRRQILGTGLAAAIVVSLPSGARAEGETFKNPSDLGDGYLRFLWRGHHVFVVRWIRR